MRGESFASVDQEEFSPPLESRHWFMLGGVWDASGDWVLPDFSGEWWQHADTANHPNQLLGDWAYRGDSDDPINDPGQTLQEKLDGLAVEKRREVLRALRGRKLRSESYALDGSSRQDKPFTVSESIHSFRDLSAEALSGEDHGIFFAYSVASRTTNWDRGDDPATSFEWSEDYDQYGQLRKTTSIACPRGFTRPDVVSSEPFLSTHGTTSFIYRDVDGGQYMVDRTEESEAFEIVDSGQSTLIGLKQSVDDGSATKEIQAHAITYYDGPAFEGLAKGEIGAYGMPVRSESLVMTDAILAEAYPAGEGGSPAYLDADSPTWPSEYPAEFKNRIDAMDGRAGYRYDSTTGRYYAPSGGKKYDFQAGAGAKGLPVEMKNPVGHTTSVTYDGYDLLPTQVDATISTTNTTLTTSATYDYRLFKPVEVTDTNGNRTKVAYSPLGLVEKTAVMGKSTETVGDTLDVPGKKFVYDLTFTPATETEPARPVSVKTIVREYHVNPSVSWVTGDETIESIEYSDGFGRVVQTRAQAEELDYERAGEAGVDSAGLPPEHGGGVQNAIPTSDPNRVRVSGWQRYNNKGKVVQKWEPFFSSGFAFGNVTQAQAGKSVKVRFDARGRQVQTIRPDGAKTLVVFGDVPDVADPTSFEPTPWKTYSWDANDYDYEVDDDGNRTAIVGGAEAHWDTPTSALVDALGRTIETVERLEGGEQLVTQTTYDIRGNVLTVVDPKGRTAATQFYDLADRKLRNESIDAGTSTAVFDAVGTPIEARDERGALTLTAADEMLRTTHQWGRDSASETVRLGGRTIFGHEMANPTATNHLGKPYQHYDEAGVVTLEAYDFKGNALENTREVIDPGLMIGAVDDASSANGYVVDTFRVDWTGDLATRKGELVDIDNSPYRTAYKSKSIFDALNRPVQMTLPADQEDADTYGYGKTITPQFNRAGALQSVQMSGTETPSVDYIAYNAKGQRILAAFGNGVMTRYAYDPNVFRLKRLRSEKYAATSTPESGYLLPSTGKKYQDIVYSYDAVGNILATDERVAEIGIAGTDTMVRGFEYDALYRLIEATGRESDVLKTDPWQDQLTAKSNAGYNDSPQITRAYTETYAYDDVGGLSLLTHQYGAGSQWTRDYTTETGSNRMTGMTSGANAYTYTYDSVGNLVQENTERHFEWDFAGRMRAFRNQVTGSAPTIFAHYSYDAGGERVQKVVCRGAKTTRTVYIGGVFEHQQVIENDSVTTENQTLHLMDDAKRVATHRAGPELDGADRAKTRYHLGDHLQSSNVVLRQVPDSSGKLFVNREEYRPYGETAFGSFEYKRYRFTGKEKDEESGLHYHSARYYAPWMARWTATDPLGMVDGPNLYVYVRGNPLRLIDPNGTASGDAPKSDDVTMVDFSDSSTASQTRPNTKEEDTLLIAQSRVADAFGTAKGETTKPLQPPRKNDASSPDKDQATGKASSAHSAFVGDSVGRAGIKEAFYGTAMIWTCGLFEMCATDVKRGKRRSQYQDQVAEGAAKQFINRAYDVVNPPLLRKSDGQTAPRDAYEYDNEAQQTGGTLSGAAAGIGGLIFPSWAYFSYGRLGPSVLNKGKKYGPHSKPGPLGAGPSSKAATFRSHTYTEKILAEPTVFYRVYGGKAGEIGAYWTRVKPQGPLQSQLDLALLPEWGNTVTDVARIRVPAGTKIFEGAAAPQISDSGLPILHGGGNQVLILNVDVNWLF
ncbi:hypothetical protein FIV42_15940 [Persicimonas caeni]|uniref:Insecticide toxin TcdB middle/C-terminal domain-containing protein n=1 Tax=Persicimonas caeni TaxID=2292766 RepID=A0A4Y6PV20_PERCE|nr:RHS repeat-associated core domain-containing protein [Persicimonas caeni]QDG52176.1 hypothetical protein FIV42_15940 [Persicimonas caeni]QED33398.1 hypothetical protein FRD00_15935 [Persicimonas caeni]